MSIRAPDVVVTINPSSDRRFRESIEACVSAGAATAGNLQTCLRAEYPSALVTNGIIDRGVERWYAYRDGHWITATEFDGVRV
jgi:hypothetical protein